MNSWEEYRKLVISELRRIDNLAKSLAIEISEIHRKLTILEHHDKEIEKFEKMREEFNQLKQDTGSLKGQLAIIAAVAGIATPAIIELVKAFFFKN